LEKIRTIRLPRRSLLSGGATMAVVGLQPIKPAFAADSGERPVTLRDNQAYTKGPFTAFLAPYNRGSLVAAVDYAESFALDPARFPAGSLLAWDWPAASANAPVRGFLAVDYGDYYNTNPQTPVPSSKVSDLEQLTCTRDLAITGTTAGFNVIINFFLTATPDPNSILFEIEVFLHLPNYARVYVEGVPPVGIFKSASGLVWNVRKDPRAAHGPDILFYLSDRSDLLVGAVDLRELLAWLTSRRVITGHEFFNGLAVGVEPQHRDGTLTVNALSINYVLPAGRNR